MGYFSRLKDNRLAIECKFRNFVLIFLIGSIAAPLFPEKIANPGNFYFSINNKFSIGCVN
jgi:hypothetical protein